MCSLFISLNTSIQTLLYNNRKRQMVVPTATNAVIIKNPRRPNERQGFHLFEIPRLPFTRLLVEHKLYITLLLILMSFIHLRRLLTFSSSALLDFFNVRSEAAHDY